MYGWKQCGRGGNKNKKVYVYSGEQSLGKLIDILLRDEPELFLNADYKMETDPRYDCGITDWIMLPATRCGMPAGANPGFDRFIVYDVDNNDRRIAWTRENGYANWAIPGLGYLYFKIAKISKTNTRKPLDYALLYGGGVFDIPTQGQEEHNARIFEDLWKSPIPGYGFGNKQYKMGNIWHCEPLVTSEDEEETVNGVVFPGGIPNKMRLIAPMAANPLWNTMYFGYPNGQIPAQNTDGYRYNDNWWLYHRNRMNYYRYDPQLTPVFTRGLNRFLLDMAALEELTIDADPNYYYNVYGFVILGV